MIDQLHALGLTVGGGIDLRRFELVGRLGIARAGLELLEPDHDLLALKAPGQQLGLKPDGVVDEHDVVDQELGQLDVAGRLGAAQADREERHALARGQLRGLGQRLSLGGLAVAQDDDRRRRCAAQLGQHLADSVSQS